MSVATDPGNSFHAYMRGWYDGAGFRGYKIEMENHPTLSNQYGEGFGAGRAAARQASKEASTKYGYLPSILRTQEESNK